MSEAVGSLDQTAQQNAALVEGMVAVAISPNAQATETVQAVAAFKLRPDSQASTYRLAGV